MRELGLTPTLFCGGGWYTDVEVVEACAELGYVDCTPRASRPPYLAGGEQWGSLSEPTTVELPSNRTLRAIPTTHSLGDLARSLASGDIEYLGRVDHQVKIRGFRIELGEIEAALHPLASLRESAVVAIQSEGFEGWLICCAYVPAEQDVSPNGLRKRLSELVPGYMLPARWMRYDALPKNDNGKIDRPRLRNAFLSAESREVHLAGAQ